MLAVVATARSHFFVSGDSLTNQLTMAETIIGIDLGTTFSCVACYDEKSGKVEVIESASGRTCPSWVSFTKEGKLVGAAAKSQVASNPRNTVYDVKRIIGRSFSDPVTAEEVKAFPFEVIEGSASQEPQIVVEWRGEKKQLRPEEVSAMVLAELKQAAEKHLGKAVKGAVITVPAHFNNQQRQVRIAEIGRKFVGSIGASSYYPCPSNQRLPRMLVASLALM